MQLAVKVLIAVILGVLMLLLGVWFIQSGFEGIPGFILNTSPTGLIFPEI